MNLQTFYDHFEYLADAPNGVAKLREMILQLAVQGKLVPQDPDDEPASVLLEKIKAEKEKLIIEKKIRKPPKKSSIQNDDIPFLLPVGWEWMQIGDIALIQGGKRLPKGVDFSPVPTPYIYIRVTNMKNGTIINNELKYIDVKTRNLISKYIIEKEDLYITIAGTIGAVGEVPKSFDRMNLTENAAKIVFRKINKKYFLLALRAKTSQDQFISRTNVLAQPKLALTRIADSLVPVPPLKEQHRIASKVDQLMALCDELETRQQKKETARARLNQSITANLLTAPTPKAFTTGWQRLCHNFDLLYDTPETIPTLRQTILQLAVQGKLVPQDPNDEPASVLLEKIKAEKEKLIKQGKIKKSKPLPPVTPEEVPYELPEGWEWAFIPQVVTNDKYAIKRGPFGSSIRKDFFVPAGYKVYEQKNAINDDFSLGKYYIDEKKFTELEAFKVVPNDIIISCSGTVGKVAIAPDWMEIGVINQALLKLTLNENALANNYFKILFPAYYMKTHKLSDLQGTAQKNMVSVDTLKKEPFPLPPLAEQHRIVAKVDQLMALCDELEKRLTQSADSSQRLTEAVIHYLTAA